MRRTVVTPSIDPSNEATLVVPSSRARNEIRVGEVNPVVLVDVQRPSEEWGVDDDHRIHHQKRSDRKGDGPGVVLIEGLEDINRPSDD